MNKKILALFISILCFLFIFISCDKKQDNGNENTEQQTSSEETSSKSDESEEEGKEEEGCVHVEEIIPAVDSTCTENGLTEGKKCSICGEILRKQDTVITTGHVIETIKGYPTSCEKAGLTDGLKCKVCGEILEEQEEIKILPHAYDYYGDCKNCTKVIGEAVVIVLDISSSMQKIISTEDGVNKSRFTVSKEAVLGFLDEFKDYDYFGLVLFHGETQIAIDLAKIGNKEECLARTEYNLNHLFYYYYLDENGKESDIVINKYDEDKYLSLGYSFPESFPYREFYEGRANFDQGNYNVIKAFGTKYNDAIDKTYRMFQSFDEEVISKKVVFISDGEPADKGSGYVEVVENMTKHGIVTTSIGLQPNNNNAIQEMKLIAGAGNGVYRDAETVDDLVLNLSITYRKAHLEKYDDFIFGKYNDRYYLVSYVGNDKNLTLPEYYNGKTYSILGDAITNNSNLQNIVIPSTVRSVADGAISNCPNLFTITIESGPSFTYYKVAINCMRLAIFYDGDYTPTSTSYSNFSSAIDVEDSKFNISVFRLTLSDESRRIVITNDGFVFLVIESGNSFLCGYIGDEIEITTPETAPNGSSYAINPFAFSKTDLKSIEISDCWSIGPYAFYDSTKLEHLKIAGSGSINSTSLLGCTALKEIDLDRNNIIREALKDCISLEKITVSADNTYLKCVDGVLYSKDGKTLIKYPSIMDANRYDILEGTTHINDYAFKGAKNIEIINIPDSVISVGGHAFEGTSIEYNELNGVYYLGNAKNPYIILVKAKDTSITEIVIPNTTQIISAYAFENCANVKKITISENVKEIGAYAFYYCTGVEVINFNATEVNDMLEENSSFFNVGYNTSGVTLNIGKNVTRIPANIFYAGSYGHYGPRITKVVFEEDSVCQSIGTGAFFRNKYLKELVIPKSVIFIERNIFGYFDNVITSVTFENKNGWVLTTSVGEEGTAVDVSDAETNATNFKSNSSALFYNKYLICTSDTIE